MSLMVGSLSSGSIGPSPVISSMISSMKSSSSCALSAMRSASTYCATRAEICRRTSPSEIFSIAERLISSISRRCRRTLASSSLSRSGEVDGAGSGLGSSFGSSATAWRLGASTTGSGSGAAAAATAASTSAIRRDAVKRPNMLASACERELALACHWRQRGDAFGFRGNEQLAERCRNVVTGFHLVERNAAVDRFAHEAEIVRDRAGKGIAKGLLDVGAAQARSEQALLEAIDDHLRRRPVRQALANHADQVTCVLQPGHRHLGDQKQAIRSNENAIGPGKPGARHVDHDIVEVRRDQIEQPRHYLEVERAHLGGAARRRDHLQARRMLRDHHFEQLAVEAVGAGLDLVEIEARLEIEIVAAGAM